MKFTPFLIAMAAATQIDAQLVAPTTTVSSSLPAGILTTASSTTPTTTTTTLSSQRPPQCRWTFNPQTPGQPGISCPVYSPWTGSYFYGHPVTREQYQADIQAFRSREVDRTLGAQQEYLAYTQDRLRYHQELALVNQERFAESQKQRMEFERQRLADYQTFQLDSLSAQRPPYAPRPGFEVSEDYLDALQQRQEWQREQLEYTLGLQEQKLQNYLELTQLQQQTNQERANALAEQHQEQLQQWETANRERIANIQAPRPVGSGFGFTAPPPSRSYYTTTPYITRYPVPPQTAPAGDEESVGQA